MRDGEPGIRHADELQVFPRYEPDPAKTLGSGTLRVFKSFWISTEFGHSRSRFLTRLEKAAGSERHHSLIGYNIA